MKIPEMFLPPAVVGPRLRRRGNAPIIQFEGHIISDLTMPEKDWSQYDSIAKGRFVSDRTKQHTTSNVTPILSAFLRRQAT